MSDTPRTDEAEFLADAEFVSRTLEDQGQYSYRVVDADFARKLERELVKARSRYVGWRPLSELPDVPPDTSLLFYSKYGVMDVQTIEAMREKMAFEKSAIAWTHWHPLPELQSISREPPPVPEPGPRAEIIVRTNPDASLDEALLFGGQFHLEQMGATHWWMELELGQRRIHINLHSKATIKANVIDDGEVKVVDDIVPPPGSRQGKR